MNYKDLFITPKIAEAPTDQEIQDAIRSYRNICLFQSDWTQLPDVNIANKLDWTVYRQQLRDMMAQSEDPKLIVFPTSPV